MDIRNSVVLITGASAGIGLATARLFAQEGARLALVARSADVLTALAGELRAQRGEAIAIPADLKVSAQATQAVAQTIQHYGRLDILINNAGQAAAGTVADVSLDDFREILELNVFAPLAAMQAAIPTMRGQGGGLIINISSMVTKMRIPGLAAYAATKVALNMLSDTARGELAADNIRVISVLPRMTATDFSANSLGSPELRQRQRTNPNAVVDPPEHVAERILRAATDEPPEQYMDS